MINKNNKNNMNKEISKIYFAYQDEIHLIWLIRVKTKLIN